MSGRSHSGRAWLDDPRVAHGVALALGLLACMVRMFRIGAQPLWFDEAMTEHIVHARHSVDFVHNAPPLYYLVLKVWVAVVGDGAAAVRSLSAVAGATFVWASFHTARTAFGSVAAVATACIALASPIHLYYSQEARAYALMSAELAIALWMAWRLQRGAGRGTWSILVIANVAALHTHYLAALPLAFGHAAIGWSAPKGERRRASRAIGSAAALAVVLVLPWLCWWGLRTPFRPRDMGWLGALWSSLSGLQPITLSLELLLLGGQAGRTPIFLKQFLTLAYPDWLRVTGFAAAVVICCLGAWRVRREPRLRGALFVSAALAIGPLVALWLISFVHPVCCPGRYDLIALPGLVLVLGGAAATIVRPGGAASRIALGAALAVLATAVVVKDWRYFAAPPAADESRAVADHLVRHVRSGEEVVLCGTTGLPVLAHLYEQGFEWSDHLCRSPQRGLEFTCRLLPSTLEEAPATVTRYVRAMQQERLATDLAGLLIAGPAGLWLVLDRDLVGPDADRSSRGTARQLFGVLDGAGYVVADDQPALGVTHWRHRGAR